MKRKTTIALAALLYTVSMLALGFSSFGFWTMLIFSSGFLGGFILWTAFRSREVDWAALKKPYLLTLVLFVFGHKTEENLFEFQEELSKITGVAVPEVTSTPLILLVLLSVGGWLIAPFLIKKGSVFGFYLAYTFFASMGITELAHFLFPIFLDKPYSYFPGMVSVVFLAPAAWWGLWCLMASGSAESRRLKHE